MEQVFDIAIIGGGINGCGIAADAALRGLKVLLLEKGDIASQTSSSSSKLIHGGLRYLEQYDFSLVKKALDERHILLSIAPHLVHPLPFVLPYDQTMRPVWLLRTGLFLYDHLSRHNKLPRSRFIRRSHHRNYFLPLTDQYKKGFLFYDCTTDDVRLTLANALQAQQHGATILTRCELLEGHVENQLWQLNAKLANQSPITFKAKALINAAGPWVSEINQRLKLQDHYAISLVKGSHLVVHRLYEGEHAYLLQNKDNRIVFVVPYHGYTMIGTTDVSFQRSELDNIAITPQEIDYLLILINHYLQHPLKSNDIITTWSGVRPLLASKDEKPQALSRDYAYHYSAIPAPVVCIYGGKITTYRQLSLEAVNLLQTVFPQLPKSSTKQQVLPGGCINDLSYQRYVDQAQEHYFWLTDSVKQRLLQTYGTRMELILANCHTMEDLGQHFGQGLYQVEVDYLVNQEWAETSEDILWRRTKLGLAFTSHEKQTLTDYLNGSKK